METIFSSSQFVSTFHCEQKRKYFVSKCVKLFFNIVKYIFLIGISFIVLYPLILQLAVAFRLPTDVSNPEVMWIPEHFSIENFKIAMKALNFWEALGTTFFNSLGVSLLQVAATACTGYAFARLNFKGKNLLFALMMATMMIPGELFTTTNIAGQIHAKIGLSKNTIAIIHQLDNIICIYFLLASLLLVSNSTIPSSLFSSNIE